MDQTVVVTLSETSNRTTVLLYGTQWTLTAGQMLSYSFPGEFSLWQPADYGGMNEPDQGFAGLAEGQERAAVRAALAAWAAVADIDFVEVADDAAGSGSLRIAYTTRGMSAQQIAYAYPPGDALASGDLWLNGALRETLFASFAPGSLAGYALLHELGHALGLKHPHAASAENGATLAPEADSIFESVMSYYAWPGLALTRDNVDRLPSTPMAQDIDALQALYGPRLSHNPGDDSYIFDGEGRYLETLFDTGGVDTIVATGSRPAEIDLRPDEWSRLGIPVQIDGGAIWQADTVRTHSGTLIENAIGGDGDDMLIGNDVANRLEGGAGRDTLVGGPGADILIGGPGADTFVLGEGDEDVIVDFDAEQGDRIVHADAPEAGTGYPTGPFAQTTSAPGGPLYLVTGANTAPSFRVASGLVTTPIGSGDDKAFSLALQADGKIVLAGSSYVGNQQDFALARYNTDGSLDTSFDGDGKLTTAIGPAGDEIYSMVVGSDGKITVAGYSINGDYDQAFARYNTNGSLDTGFSADGKLVIDVAGILGKPGRNDIAYALARQTDGKVVAAGYYNYSGTDIVGGGQQAYQDNDMTALRLTSSGTVDSTFSGDGVATVDFSLANDQGKGIAIQADGRIVLIGDSTKSSTSANDDIAVIRMNSSGSFDTGFYGSGGWRMPLGPHDDFARSVLVKPDGKILVAGNYVAAVDANNFADYDFFVLGVNSDGSTDSGFGDGGLATVNFGTANDIAYNGLALQADGKILLAGYTYNGINYDVALARFNADGSLDTSFSGDGKVTVQIGYRNDFAYDIAVQADGKIVLGGYRLDYVTQNNDFALVRFNSDGTLDRFFGPAAQTLNGTPRFVEDGEPVVLDADVQVADTELVAAGNYAGAELTLSRHGGANGDDRYHASGNLAPLAEGQPLVLGVTAIGNVVQNSGGTLRLAFNSAATQDRVDEALHRIAYANASDTPPATVQIDWSFSDGNTGMQGSGGALAASGSTVVSILATDDNIPIYFGTASSDAGTQGERALVGTAEADRLFSLGGDDLVKGFGGDDVLYGGAGDDQLQGGPGRDVLAGGTGQDSLDGGAGNDVLDGGEGSDTLNHYTASGNDTLSGGPGGDTFTIFCGRSANSVTVSGGEDGDLIAVDMTAPTAADTITASGGAGSDTFSFSALSLSDAAGFNRLADLTLPVVTVTDFASGPGGDRIATAALLEISASGGRGYAGGNPFATSLGYLRLLESSGNTLLQWDMDGAARSLHAFETFMVLRGVAKSSLTAENFHDGIVPDGGTVTGLTLTDTADVPGSLTGAYGNDTLNGAWGADVLHGLAGNDVLNGGPDGDTLYGNAGNDTLTGGDGGVTVSEDTLDGGPGNDTLNGGADNDRLIHRPAEGSDTMSGGSGDDVFDIDIAGIAGQSEVVSADGGDGADMFVFSVGGTVAAETLLMTGGGGRDAYILADAAATRAGAAVTDFTLGAGGDLIFADVLMQASATGGNGYVGGNPFNTSQGYLRLLQSGMDTLLQWDRDGAARTRYTYQTVLTLKNRSATGFTADNFVEGYGPGGTDVASVTVSPAASDDSRVGSFVADTMNGGDGNDLLRGASGSDAIAGGNGNDTLYGDAGHDTLNGGAGNDELHGGAGNDIVFGGDGDDVLDHLSGEGGDVLDGGAGNDRFAFDFGSFVADGELVHVLGGAGNDTLSIRLGSNWAAVTRIEAAGGSGQDLYEFTSVADNRSAGSPLLAIGDFATGASGDQLDVNVLLDLSAKGNNGYSSGSPFRPDLGYLRLVQNGTATELQHDLDGVAGLANGFRTVVVLKDTARSAITLDNFVGKYIVGTEDPDVLTGDWGNDKIFGLAGDDRLAGAEGDDFLDGGADNDTLDGGVGADRMEGGDGGDTYYVNDAGDLVVEVPNPAPGDSGLVLDIDLGAAIDSVVASISYTLANYVENLTLAENKVSPNLEATGNELANQLAGNSGANILKGLAGDDTLKGLAGNDVLNGGEGNDTLEGGSGNDTYIVDEAGDNIIENSNLAGEIDAVVSRISWSLANYAQVENLALAGSDAIDATGNAKANLLAGNDAANVLDGGGGTDTLKGGKGDDTYQVALKQSGTLLALEDVVSENLNEGNDSLRLTGSIVLAGASTLVLPANVEQLDASAATGSKLNLTGNGLHNRLKGNELANVLSGGAGNDSYEIDSLDSVVELAGAGTDTVLANFSYSLPANVENLMLTGAADINATGNTLGNLLGGNAGVNVLTGGLGNDSYIVSAGDTVIETSTLGTEIDSVIASITWSLAALPNIENLALSGSDAIDATGNARPNVLTGNAGANVLDGGAGNDTYVVQNVDDSIVESSDAAGEIDLVQSHVSWTLGDNLENLSLLGTGAIDATGNARANLLLGNDAANRLDGGAGNDTLKGGRGDDSYTVDLTGANLVQDLVVENLSEGSDTLILRGGNAGLAVTTLTLPANFEHLDASLATGIQLKLTGNGLNNRLTGNDLANVLSGGVGNDSYEIDSLDSVVELAGAGTDTVLANFSCSLPANVENLTLTGTGDINATGNTMGNLLTGNVGANVLIGSLGNDTYVVGTGDTVIETSTLATEIDTVIASVNWSLADLAQVEHLTLTGSDAINATGNAKANILTGNAVANQIDGGLGIDTLKGGAGNDTYTVDLTNANLLQDVIVENLNEGSDTLILRGGNTNLLTTTTLVLAANLEHLDVSATSLARLNLTGNAAANTLTGNAWGNLLDGGAGADTLVGGAGNDSYRVDAAQDAIVEAEGEGEDRVIVTFALANQTYVLAPNVEHAKLVSLSVGHLTGNELANSLSGNDAANRLDGGAGNDSLSGGLGNDTYVVDSATDTITDTGGIDSVLSSVGWTLASGLEHLALTGNTDIDGTGNALANTLTGNTGANLLDGAAGNDTLIGAAGDDSYRAGIGDLVSEIGVGVAGGGSDALELRAATAGLASALAAAFDSFAQDLKFSKANAGRDLRIDFAVNGGASAGALTVAGMANAESLVEVLRLYNANGTQIGGDIDLASVWAAATPTPRGLTLTAESSSFGILVA